VTLRPAWSDAFATERLARVSAVGQGTLSREWAFGSASGVGVTVAVVDSGVEAGHPRVGDVHGYVAFQLDPGAPGGVRLDENPHDDAVGHGTACAGIVRSLAPDVRLLSVKVLGERLSGRGNIFAAGLRWAVATGAQVVNCSLSSNRQDHAAAFHEIADLAAHAGVVIVCAANNLPGVSIPAVFSSVISVAAGSGTDPERWQVNPSPPVEFGAPGLDVEVAWRGGGSIVTTGNSFAAPHIAAHVARLMSAHPGITPYEVKTVLRALADNAS
jgi:subtilisin family serine protease